MAAHAVHESLSMASLAALESGLPLRQHSAQHAEAGSHARNTGEAPLASWQPQHRTSHSTHESGHCRHRTQHGAAGLDSPIAAAAAMLAWDTGSGAGALVATARRASDDAALTAGTSWLQRRRDSTRSSESAAAPGQGRSGGGVSGGMGVMAALVAEEANAHAARGKDSLQEETIESLRRSSLRNEFVKLEAEVQQTLRRMSLPRAPSATTASPRCDLK
jgi:hypothetical protein